MKHDYIYDIIDFWLSSQENEYYMSELLKKYDKVFNLSDRSITEVILDRFILSCNNYIDNIEDVSFEYYLRLFNKAYNSEKYDHKNDIYLQERIYDYMRYVSKLKMNDIKKSNIISGIKALGLKQEHKDIIYKKDKALQNLVKNLEKLEIKEEKRIDLTNDLAFTIKSNNYNEMGICYNVVKNDNNIILNYHIIDILKLIYEGSEVYNNMMENNKLNPYLINCLTFKENHIKPCITISIEINKNGKANNFNVFKSIVKPSFSIDKKTSVQSLKQNTITNSVGDVMTTLMKNYKIHNDNIIDLFNYVLNETIGGNVYSNDVPFIYKVHLAGSSSEIEYQIANLNYYLFRIPYEDYKIIYDIICNKNNNKAHYSLENYGHYASNTRYKLELKPFTYVGFNSLSLINDLYINKITKEEIEDKYRQKFEDLTNYYNKKLFCIDDKKSMKRKLK